MLPCRGVSRLATNNIIRVSFTALANVLARGATSFTHQVVAARVAGGVAEVKSKVLDFSRRLTKTSLAARCSLSRSLEPPTACPLLGAPLRCCRRHLPFAGVRSLGSPRRLVEAGLLAASGFSLWLPEKEPSCRRCEKSIGKEKWRRKPWIHLPISLAHTCSAQLLPLGSIQSYLRPSRRPFCAKLDTPFFRVPFRTY